MPFIEIIALFISLMAIIYLWKKNVAQNESKQEQIRHAQNEEKKRKNNRQPKNMMTRKEFLEEERGLTPPLFSSPQFYQQDVSYEIKSHQQERQHKEKQVVMSHEKHMMKAKTVQTRLDSRSPALLHVRHLHKEDAQIQLQPSRAHQAIKRLSRLQDLIIYQEILNKPKSLRVDFCHEFNE